MSPPRPLLRFMWVTMLHLGVATDDGKVTLIPLADITDVNVGSAQHDARCSVSIFVRHTPLRRQADSGQRAYGQGGGGGEGVEHSEQRVLKISAQVRYS